MLLIEGEPTNSRRHPGENRGPELQRRTRDRKAWIPASAEMTVIAWVPLPACPAVALKIVTEPTNQRTEKLSHPSALHRWFLLQISTLRPSLNTTCILSAATMSSTFPTPKRGCSMNSPAPYASDAL